MELHLHVVVLVNAVNCQGSAVSRCPDSFNVRQTDQELTKTRLRSWKLVRFVLCVVDDSTNLCLLSVKYV